VDARRDAAPPGGVHLRRPRQPRGRRAGDRMSLAARIAGFATVLALVFGAAALAGSRIDARPGENARDAAPAMGAMAANGPGAVAGTRAPQTVRGLAVSEGGLTLDLAGPSARPGERTDLV